ncbi:TPA: hypothetical protein JBB34_00595 [Legionella pneumophila subsp. pneumophila]|nr:hypothetical protein [Legionella pneumophila subsp. pneumophila]
MHILPILYTINLQFANRELQISNRISPCFFLKEYESMIINEVRETTYLAYNSGQYPLNNWLGEAMDYLFEFMKNNALWLIGVLLSWLFTHIYYKKSLKQQAKEANKENLQLLAGLKKEDAYDKEVFKQQLIEKALEEFIRKGTPIGYINTLDVSDEEKADIYNKACLRKKGRLPKNNPYSVAE